MKTLSLATSGAHAFYELFHARFFLPSFSSSIFSLFGVPLSNENLFGFLWKFFGFGKTWNCTESSRAAGWRRWWMLWVSHDVRMNFSLVKIQFSDLKHQFCSRSEWVTNGHFARVSVELKRHENGRSILIPVIFRSSKARDFHCKHRSFAPLTKILVFLSFPLET